MRVLITGVTGFVGRHLAQHLAGKDCEVFGLDRLRQSPRTIGNFLTYYACDINDRAALAQVLDETRPDIVYHLAGLLKSLQPNEFYIVNLLGTITLFEALGSAKLRPLTLVASSSAVYGAEPHGRRITEGTSLSPLTDYAISKAAQELVVRRFHRTHQIPTITGRAFNIIGPGQSPEFACSAFARQIARAEQGLDSPVIRTGTLTSKRDFIDVRDVVQAYDLLARAGQPGLTYNICSERAVTIQQCLDSLIAMARVHLHTELNTEFVQAVDVPAQVGSAALLRRHTGWRRTVALRKSLRDVLDYWRQELEEAAKG
jgi:GDP-4-dehydro-6-deoxy-D-mannose reductase